MADNKVVNTTQLEADLTSVANAIREKAGSTDSLAFPDGFVSAIGGILGMPSEIAELSTGVYVPASSANLTLEHGLSQKPHFAVFCAPVISSTGTSSVVFMSSIKDGSDYTFKAYAGYAGGNWTNCSQVNGYLFADKITMYSPTLTVGTTYYWVCGIFNT